MRIPSDDPAAEVDMWCQASMVCGGTLKGRLALLYSDCRGGVEDGCVGSESVDALGGEVVVFVLVLFQYCQS